MGGIKKFFTITFGKNFLRNNDAILSCGISPYDIIVSVSTEDISGSRPDIKIFLPISCKALLKVNFFQSANA